MLRGAIIVFICSWLVWFWIDKSPAALGPLPWPAQGEVLQNFQVAMDLVKETRFKAAFVYLWKAHFILLSLGFGLLIGAGINLVARNISRKRLLKLYLPDRKKQQKQE